MIAFACAHCGKRLKVADDRAGKRGKCPSCGQKTRIPQSGATSANGGLPRNTPSTGSLARPGTGGDSTARRPKKVTPEDYAFLTPPQTPDELGRLGHYRVLNVLGCGGMGIVFEAEDVHLQRRVALKAMKPAVVTPANRERFLHEARATAAIEHDHIVTIYQVGEDRGVPYLAMKLLQGESLEDKLKEEGGWLPVPAVLRIGREIAEGLEAAHSKGLIHRDIKPANIWLEGERGRVKIVDFGLARAAEVDLNLTQEGLVMGTPAYMAPEQAEDKPLDHRCDLFSLGCVLYRAVTGQLPFKGKDSMAIMMSMATKDPDPPHEVDPLVPAPVSELIMELLAKDPDDRPSSAKAVRIALENLEQQLAGATTEPVSKRAPVDDGDLKPLDDEKARKEDSDEDVMILEVDESAEAVDEVEEVEEVRPARPKSGPRTKRRQEKPEPEESDSVRAVIILGAIVAGLIILLLTFIFIKRAMHSEGTASTKHPPGSATVLVMSHTGADHWGVQSTSSV